MSKFFQDCIVEGSKFDINYAEQSFHWKLLERIFIDNFKSHINTIPRILHFVWLGSELPNIYAKNIENWQQKNPNFKIKIWDDESANQLMMNSSKYEVFKRAENFGVKSDILRYQILYDIGGIYLDTDFVCCSNSFLEIADSYSFFAGVMFDKNPIINNAIMGSSARNKIILQCLERCSDQTHLYITCKETRTLFQTGPFLLTECIFDNIESGMRIFPTKTFFPFPAIHRNEATEELVHSYITEETLACHLWHCSWQPDSKFYVGENNA